MVGEEPERGPLVETSSAGEAVGIVRGTVAHAGEAWRGDRTLEAFELRDGEWVLIGCAKDDEPVSIRRFDAVTFSLGDLWP